MVYSFPDGAQYTLNMCPIRKNYVRRLLNEAGFQRVRTYGDFQDAYAEDDPDFFIHVAEKSAHHLVRWGGVKEDGEADIRDITETTMTATTPTRSIRRSGAARICISAFMTRPTISAPPAI